MMKEIIRKSIFLAILLILIISFCGAGAYSYEIDNDQQKNNIINPKVLDKGEIRFGIVTIDSEYVEGIDQTEYLGILTDINLQISGESSIIIVPIPFMIFSSVFDTQDDINIHMDSAWVSVTQVEEYISIIAFAKTVTWEWV